MKDTEVFEGKNLSDLLKDIHDNTTKKRTDINNVVVILTQMIKNPDDAVMLIPLIKDFYDVSIKNDEQMVKIATIVQRLISADSYSNGEGEGIILSEAEKDRLIANALSDINAHMAVVDTNLSAIKENVNSV